MSPDLYSFGHITTSWVVSLNWSSVLLVTFWNCVKTTRDFAHSPSLPKVMSPTTVLNEWLRM